MTVTKKTERKSKLAEPAGARGVLWRAGVEQHAVGHAGKTRQHGEVGRRLDRDHLHDRQAEPGLDVAQPCDGFVGFFLELGLSNGTLGLLPLFETRGSSRVGASGASVLDVPSAIYWLPENVSTRGRPLLFCPA